MLGLGNHNKVIVLERKSTVQCDMIRVTFTKLISVAVEKMNCSVI